MQGSKVARPRGWFARELTSRRYPPLARLHVHPLLTAIVNGPVRNPSSRAPWLAALGFLLPLQGGSTAAKQPAFPHPADSERILDERDQTALAATALTAQDVELEHSAHWL